MWGHARRWLAALGWLRGRWHPDGVDERNAELDRRIDEGVERLNATLGWPWQQPGVTSVALDEHGKVMRYLATETGFVVLGPAG